MTRIATRTGNAVIAVIASFALVLSLAGGLGSAFAVTSEEKQAEADAVWAKVDELQTKLNEAMGVYNEAVARHEAALQGMQDAQAREEAAKARITELQGELSERAADMYRDRRSNTYLDVLLGATTFEEFLTSWDMMSRIASHDALLIHESKEARAEAEAARAEYAKQEATAQEQVELSERVAGEISAQKDELAAEASKLSAEAAELQAQEEAAAEAARRAKEYADSVERGEVPVPVINENADNGGALFANPCPESTQSSGYGWRDFDMSFHKGTDMAAPQGTSVYAAESGTVLYAVNDGGWNGGAGNWIWISHGAGMATKYMHLSNVFVHTGDFVERGQLIGLVGTTGDSTGPHLHFQVELNGEAISPYLF